jgi:type II secretory pathway component PulC
MEPWGRKGTSIMTDEFKKGDVVFLDKNNSTNPRYYSVGEHGDKAVVRNVQADYVFITYPGGEETNWLKKDTKKEGDKSMCNTTTEAGTENKAAENPNAGKLFIDLTVREFFDTEAEREHYIKEHLSADYDIKAAVLANGEFSKYDGEADTLVTVKTGKEQ